MRLNSALSRYRTLQGWTSVVLVIFSSKGFPKVSFNNHLIRLDRQTIDVTDFFKLIVDFTVHNEIQASTNPKELINQLPATDKGGIYFFPPLDQFG